MKARLFLFVVSLFWMGSQVVAQGCSQCRMLSEQGTELDESSFGTNINSGILYLMIIPYLLLMFLFRKRIVAFFKRSFSK